MTGVTGRLSWNGLQFAPSSKEMYRPNSVPASSRPFRSGSSRTTLVKWRGGMPFLPFVSRSHVRP